MAITAIKTQFLLVLSLKRPVEDQDSPNNSAIVNQGLQVTFRSHHLNRERLMISSDLVENQSSWAGTVWGIHVADSHPCPEVKRSKQVYGYVQWFLIASNSSADITGALFLGHPPVMSTDFRSGVIFFPCWLFRISDRAVF